MLCVPFAFGVGASFAYIAWPQANPDAMGSLALIAPFYGYPIFLLLNISFIVGTVLGSIIAKKLGY